MFRITRDPSSGNLIQCLAKITVMALSCPLTWTQSVLWQHILTRCACVYCTVQRATLSMTSYATGKIKYNCWIYRKMGLGIESMNLLTCNVRRRSAFCLCTRELPVLAFSEPEIYFLARYLQYYEQIQMLILK